MAMAIVIVLLVSVLGSAYVEDPLEGFSARFGNELGRIQVDGNKIQDSIDKLAAFSDTPAPSVTRLLYTHHDVSARRFVRDLMESAQLTVREDPIGNIFGLWEGSEPSEGVVASGSHTDAIPFAGKYDGVVGVVGAIEAVKALRRAGFNPRRSLEVIMFTSEEPTRFGISCLGSRMLSGDPTLVSSLKGVTDKDGLSFFEAAKRAGYSNEIENISPSNGTYAAFVELHIEQGPLLEEQGLAIGIVTAIAGPASIDVEYTGDGGHAGAVLMRFRKDAGLAAAELALAVERHVIESGSEDTVGTTGVMELSPGAVNSIPRRARLGIDVRDVDEHRRSSVIQRVRESATAIANQRGVNLQEFKIINEDAPARSAEFVVETIRQASEELGLGYSMMVSRAYHDTLFMSRIAPTAMIFIPCYRGYSHRPDEFASVEDMENGVRVLALTLAKLSSMTE